MSQPDKSHVSHLIAGEKAILARRYAGALFDLADERNAVEPVAADLLALQEVLDSDPHFHAMASHPRLPAEKLKAAISQLSDKVKFHPLTKSFLIHVAENHRLGHLGDMIEAFQADLAEKRGQHVAFVTAAHALSDAQQQGLAGQLGKLVGGSVRLVLSEDSSLIGGLIIRLGSRRIDASVQGKLAQIERQLKTQREAA